MRHNYVLVTPLNTDREALEATARTLESLPGIHLCQRNESDNSLILDEGRLVVLSSDPHFLIFAIRQQGYGIAAQTGDFN